MRAKASRQLSTILRLGNTTGFYIVVVFHVQTSEYVGTCVEFTTGSKKYTTRRGTVLAVRPKRSRRQHQSDRIIIGSYACIDPFRRMFSIISVFFPSQKSISTK